MILLDFVAANICVYFQYLFMPFVCANIFGAIVLKLRFKIDIVVMIIRSIVIIINSFLTLEVLTTSLPHDCEPCKIKVVPNHTCSLHTCVCDGSRRVRVRLSGLINGRNQFNSWGSPQVPHSGPGLCRTTPNGQFVSIRQDKCVARKKSVKGIMQNKGTILYLLRRCYQLFTVTGKTPAHKIFSTLFFTLYTQKSILNQII